MKANPQYVVLFHRFRGFLERANAAGIDVAPLKGAHLLTSVYPEDGDRGVIADVDFLVRPERWGDATAIALELGWRRRPSAVDEERAHEIGFESDVGGGRRALFEMHRALFEPRRFRIDHDAIWRRAARGFFEGAPCLRLAPEDHFAHIAFHEAIHRLGSLGRALRDLELLAVRGPVSSGDLFERAREWSVTRVVWLMLELMAASEPELQSVKRREEIAPPRRARRALLGIARMASSGELARLHHRWAAALLWPWAFDSKVDLARFVLSHPSAAGAFFLRRSRSGTSRSDPAPPPARAGR